MNAEEFFKDFIENTERYLDDMSAIDYNTKVAIHDFLNGIIQHEKGELDKGDLVMALLAGYNLKVHLDRQALEKLNVD